MLGSQQIAGIPTAISELFKNAHDAYATTVEIDFYRSDGLVVLRDDGIGMTPDDFRRFWLTIGTESKLDPPTTRPIPPNMPMRPMLGEKGIGRLSIATIGPQVLVLTRAWQEHGTSDLTVAFVNWSLYECPGVALDDIQIPVRVIPNGDLPTKDDTQSMIGEFHENGNRLKGRVDAKYINKLNNQLACFDVDPVEIDSHCTRLSLRGTGSGTHFILLPTSPLLPRDIDGDRDLATPLMTKATPLKQALLGFTNTMTPDAVPSPIKTAFRDHPTDDYFDDIVSSGEFFTQDEFRNADHQFVGEFDKHGQFVGEIHIYGDLIARHVIPWRNPRGLPTKCGPFKIAFAAVEPESNRTTLPPEDHTRMIRKLNQIGGLYIYRDGVRILPYGNTDYDWLDIEYRRTKGAGYYYFSHRKIFGAVLLDSERNGQLSEKAGREGFRENAAYRDFKRILMSFLLQVAADFFRKDGLHTDIFQERRDELREAHEVARRRRRQVQTQRRTLNKELDAFFVAIAGNEPARLVETLAVKVEDQLRHVRAASNPGAAALRLEKNAYAELRAIERKFHISRPRIPFNRGNQVDWDRYRSKYLDLSKDVFIPARESVERLVDEAISPIIGSIDRRRRAEKSLLSLSKELAERVKRQHHTVASKATERIQEVHAKTTQWGKDLEDVVREVLSEFQSSDLSPASPEGFVKVLARQESKMLKVSNHAIEQLGNLEAQLDALDVTGRASVLDQLVVVEQRVQALEDQLAMDTHLVQIGMAVEIINHEFGATVRSVRNNLRRLKAWADANPELNVLYRDIRSSFDHLDGYLTMFTPLQRRLYRKRIDIRGADIAKFLRDLFRIRLSRHGISLRSTGRFSATTVRSFPSSFYPVFVNLVDNAIYWVSQRSQDQERHIVLDADGDRLVVSDSGPGVEPHDRDRIFEFGFSRKPGGRGMGLYIARETLRRVGYEIHVVRRTGDAGTRFAIEPTSEEMEAKDE